MSPLEFSDSIRQKSKFRPEQILVDFALDTPLTGYPQFP
jgi:hypothetical protein